MADPKLGPENTVDAIGLCHEVSQFSLGKGIKTASATAGAATLNQPSGRITTESLATAAGADYTLTLTNSKVSASDIVNAMIIGGTNTGTALLLKGVPSDTGIVFTVRNIGAGAFNGTIIIGYELIKGV